MRSKFHIPVRDDLLNQLQIFCRDQYDKLKRIHTQFINSTISATIQETFITIKDMATSYEILLIGIYGKINRIL